MNEKELYHFGIKGMKWGVWNEETKARHLGGKRAISQDESRKRELLKKKPSQLSNKELLELNNRLNLENQLKNNKRNGRNVTKRIVGKFGDKVVEKLVEKAAVAAITTGTAIVMKHYNDTKGSN